MFGAAVTSDGTNRVATLTALRTIELREEPIPVAPAGGAVVRVRAALTDGTDLKTYRRGHPKFALPTRFGHEFSGDVVAAGDGAPFAVGEAIACVHSAPCGTCYWCESGQEECCESLIETMILGAYADFIAVPARILRRNAFHKPAQVSYREAAFLEPLACVVHSVAALGVRPGASVAIVGDGAFGILHAQWLRGRGMRPISIGRRAERLALAAALGLETIDARSGDLRAELLARTGGRGADVAIDCTGLAQVWEQAPGLVRRGGTVSFFGGLPGGTQVSFDAARLHYDALTLLAPFHFRPADVRVAYEAIAGRQLELLPLLSHAYPLEQIGEAFSAMDAGEGMKMAIEP